MPPTDDQLRRFLAGTLSADEADGVVAWLDSDPDAGDRLAGLGDPDALAQALLRGGTPFPTGPRADGSLEALADALRGGEYRVVRELGRGGMGVVEEAEDPRLRRRVAIKRMLPEVAARPDAKARFLREARAMAAVSSDHIVPILHVGEQPDGTPYLVMPLLTGETLAARLDRGPLTADELRMVARDTAAGLADAHARNLIHRDIKPNNLWLEATPDGALRRVRLLDFGLAVPQTAVGALTDSRVVVGTPKFMSPEQARGDAVGPPSDLFGLGCVLYRAAADRPPFDGETVTAVLTALAVDDPTPVRLLAPAVPPDLAELIHALLRKAPDQRPTAADVLARLSGATPPAPRRSRLRLAVAAGAVAALVVAALVAVVAWPRPAPPDDPAVSGRVPPANPTDLLPDPPTVVRPTPRRGEPLGPGATVKNPTPFGDILSWTVDTKRPRGGQFQGHRASLSPDGKRLAVLADVTLRVYDAATLAFDRAFAGADHSGFPFAARVRWLPGDRIAVEKNDQLILWQYPSGTRTELTWAAAPLGVGTFVPAVAPDGRVAAMPRPDGVLQLCTPDGDLIGSVRTDILNLGHVAWSADGRWIACAGSVPATNKWRVAVIDATARTILWGRDVSAGTVQSVAVTAGGRRVAVATHMDRATVCDGETTRTLPVGGSQLTFSDDGERLFGTGTFDPVKQYPGVVCTVATGAVEVLVGTPLLSAITPSGRETVVGTSTGVEFHAAGRTEPRRLTALGAELLGPGNLLTVAPDGHYSVADPHRDEVVYVVATAAGLETLTPAEFEKRTGWKNDPTKAPPAFPPVAPGPGGPGPTVWTPLAEIARIPELAPPPRLFVALADDWEARAKRLPREEQFAEVLAELRRRNPDARAEDFSIQPTRTNDAAGVLLVAHINTDEVRDLTPLRAVNAGRLHRVYLRAQARPKAFTALDQLRGVPVDGLALTGLTGVTDLTALKGLPLTFLDLSNSPVSDLTPLAELPLKTLRLYETAVSDLAPIRNLKLTYLDYGRQFDPNGTGFGGVGEVSDLNPLKDMPLERLDLGDCKVRDLRPVPTGKLKMVSLRMAFPDLTPLAGSGVETLHLHDAVTHLAVLQALPKLKSVSSTFPYQTDGPPRRLFDAIDLIARRDAEFFAKADKLTGDELVAAIEAELLTRTRARYEAMGQPLPEDGSWKPKLGYERTDGKVVGVIVIRTGMDLTPVAALRDVRKLTLTDSPGLSVGFPAMARLPLVELDVQNGARYFITGHLDTLARMPALKTINGQPAADFRKEHGIELIRKK